LSGRKETGLKVAGRPDRSGRALVDDLGERLPGELTQIGVPLASRMLGPSASVDVRLSS